MPTGVTTPTYTLGRLAEASTDNCSGTLKTDEWFSYDKDGHVLDQYEFTPNSTAYYHSTATFFGNGAVNTLRLVGPSKTVTYGLDGEGRWNSLVDTSTGTTIVNATNTTFNAAGQPTEIALGTSTDQDDYTYDLDTGRMTGWTFQIGATPKTETAILTWNPLGTLKSLAITDGFNAGGTQTCNFGVSGSQGYDDWNRLLYDSCGTGGSLWNQTFSLDEYNNLTKSSTGFVSWNPGYSSTTNHYTCTGCTYDANGDVTNDGTNAYAWNEFSKMKSVNVSETIVYDAFGRAVETDAGGTYTEIWYTQLGKTAYMSGTTLNYAYYPTPGGGTYLKTNGGQVYFHKDWLGNARLTSSITGQTVDSDRAFAPYGEIYDIFGSTAQNRAMFTGDTQDVIAGMYDTPNRELQGSQQGRWLSPDPAGAGWNQYAYPSDPNDSIDPSGLACYPLERAMFGSCAGFMNNGVNFGSDWNEFDVMNIPVVTTTLTYIPPTLTYPPTLYDTEGNEIPDPLYTLFQTTGGWQTTTTIVGSGFDLFSGNSGSGSNSSPANNGPTNCAPGSPGCSNVPTQRQLEGIKEQQCEQQAQAAFGPFVTQESLTSTLFRGSHGVDSWQIHPSYRPRHRGFSSCQIRRQGP